MPVLKIQTNKSLLFCKKVGQVQKTKQLPYSMFFYICGLPRETIAQIKDGSKHLKRSRIRKGFSPQKV